MREEETFGMLVRLGDGELSKQETLDAITCGLREFGSCWIPLLGSMAPGEGREEAVPYLLIGTETGKVDHVLDIEDAIRMVTAAELETDSDCAMDSRFENVGQAVWVKASAAPELGQARTYDVIKGLQGVNYYRLDRETGQWRHVYAETLPKRARPATSSARPASPRARAGTAPTGTPTLLERLQRIVVDRPMRVLGIDLTASSAKASAACVLRATPAGIVVEGPPRPLRTDEEIRAFIRSEEWDCISLDGPRTSPNGFSGFVERGQEPPDGTPKSRKCERDVSSRVSSIFYYSPRARAGVRAWLQRSVALFRDVEDLGKKVIEIYPHASFVGLLNGTAKRGPSGIGLKSKPQGLANREALLEQLLGDGMQLPLGQGDASRHDIVDATAAAATGLLHALGETEALGDSGDGGAIEVPKRRVEVLDRA